jgi:hypothetical protein
LTWSREFDEPIALPDRGPLRTLRDAGEYIAALSKSEHNAPEWRAAMQALILVAEGGGPTLFARIGLMRALNAGKLPQVERLRKRSKVYRVIR